MIYNITTVWDDRWKQFTPAGKDLVNRTEYDVFGRAILSGIYLEDDYTSNDVNLRVYLMRELYKNIVSKESVSSSGGNYFYTWNTFPAKDQSEVTRIYFYDDYTYVGIGTSFAPTNGNLAFQKKTGYGDTIPVKDLLTGTWDKLLGDNGWIKTTYYYDTYGNLVQKRSSSTNRGYYNYEYYAYNYNNQMTKKYIEHSVMTT
jgi:hypothetical protein